MEVAGARIIDLAPTILYLLDVPVPEDMDGRVLEAIISDDFLGSHPLQMVVENDSAVANAPESPYSAVEEEIISERLKALGYID
jgi:hypothetical protein